METHRGRERGARKQAYALFVCRRERGREGEGGRGKGKVRPPSSRFSGTISLRGVCVYFFCHLYPGPARCVFVCGIGDGEGGVGGPGLPNTYARLSSSSLSSSMAMQARPSSHSPPSLPTYLPTYTQTHHRRTTSKQASSTQRAPCRTTARRVAFPLRPEGVGEGEEEDEEGGEEVARRRTRAGRAKEAGEEEEEGEATKGGCGTCPRTSGSGWSTSITITRSLRPTCCRRIRR